MDFDAILTTKFWKKIFFWCSYSYWKDLSIKNVVVLKFLLKVPKFRENIVICVITVKKVRNCLLTLLQVITILRHSFNNEWTQIIFFILPGITCFSLRFALFYIETLHNSIFLYLISCGKLLFKFLLVVDFLRSLLVSIASSQQNIIKMKILINNSNVPYWLWASLFCLCINSFACVFVAYASDYLFFSTYSLISNKRKKSTIGLSHIAPQNQAYCFNYLIAQKL